jgi:hypothetical protein
MYEWILSSGEANRDEFQEQEWVMGFYLKWGSAQLLWRSFSKFNPSNISVLAFGFMYGSLKSPRLQFYIILVLFRLNILCIEQFQESSWQRHCSSTVSGD